MKDIITKQEENDNGSAGRYKCLVYCFKTMQKKKKKPADQIVLSALSDLIIETRVKIIGPIRQELLSGISEEAHYQKLKKHLSAFEDLPINCENFERAADMFNHCRKKGVNGSHVDLLICSISEYYHLSIFTTDKDFSFYSKHLPIKLYRPDA